MNRAEVDSELDLYREAMYRAEQAAVRMVSRDPLAIYDAAEKVKFALKQALGHLGCVQFEAVMGDEARRVTP